MKSHLRWLAGILLMAGCLSVTLVAQEGQWPYHPTHPKGPPSESPDPRYADLTQEQRDAVARALDALLGLLGCPWIGSDAEVVLLGEIMALELMLASGDIVSWSQDDDPNSKGLRTLADSTNQQGDSIFSKDAGNVVAVDGFEQIGSIQSFGNASTTSGNDAMFGALLAGELAHQDMHCRMDDNGAFLADPAGTPGGLNHWQMLQSYNASEVEAASRSIELLNAFMNCPPPLNALDAKRFAKTVEVLEKFKKQHGG